MKPRIVKIYSENNHYQHAETLRRNREKRHKHKEFFVEGVRAINQALQHDWTINAFLYSREQRLSGWAQDVLARSQAQVHYELPLALLEKLSKKTQSPALFCIVATPGHDPSRIPIR